jgi:hypothetical protein
MNQDDTADPNVDPLEGLPAKTRMAQWIDGQPRAVLTLFAMTAAFTAYLSMYAFRKPFTAVGYSEISQISLFGVLFSYKPIAVTSQLLGYMCSKLLGVKFASEASFSQRAPIVLGLIAFAELMLILFGLVPAPYNIIFLFFNGLPLGMVWSMLFGILEGRRVTEFLALGLSVSVVFASGIVKGVGLWTIESFNVPVFWMPALTGLLFVPLLLISLWMLSNTPPPDQQDRDERTRRAPMDKAERRKFLKEFFPGVVFIVGGYLCLMTYRALRDDFMDLILADLNYQIDSKKFITIESSVGVCVIAALSLLWFFRDNKHAVWANMVLIALGAILNGSSTLLLYYGYLGPENFYVCNGVGLYIAYVPYQSIFVDRLLASLHTVATGAFLLAICDSGGYIAVVAMNLTKDLVPAMTGTEIDWVTLLMMVSAVVTVVVPAAMIGCAVYFNPRMRA